MSSQTRRSGVADCDTLTPVKGLSSSAACPMAACTLPAMRHRSRISETTKSPFKRRFGSPTAFGSPSRLETLLKCYRWREVKGHLGDCIGRGGFGCVYKATIHGYEVAVKKLRYTLMNKKAILKSLHSERLASNFHHRNVVTIYSVNERSDPAYVIMEYAGDSNLQQVIDEHHLSSKQVHMYSEDLASALDFIHSQRIVHLDVKPSNIIITRYNVAKLGDFGCSQKLNWDDEADIVSPTNRSDITGTIAYRSPELLKGCPPSTKADIYAYGIVLWQMLSGRHPYSGKNSHMVIFGVVAHHLRPSLTDLDGDDDILSLCQRCWSADPESRPEANLILSYLSELSLSSGLVLKQCKRRLPLDME